MQSTLAASVDAHSASTIEHAKRYVERGWRLVPIVPGGKQPHTQLLRDLHGTNSWAFLRDKPATLDTVRRWLTHTPDLNLAIIPGDGLAVVDVDDPEKFTGSHPPTPTVATTRGRHMYFAGELRPGKSGWGDIPATYCVAPPSRVDGAERYWLIPDTGCLAKAAEFNPGGAVLAPVSESARGASTALESQSQPIRTRRHIASSTEGVETPTDRLATLPEAVLAVARYHGVEISRVEQAFRCYLPGHGPDEKPSANYWQAPDDVYVYRDHHRASGSGAYTLAEVHAAVVSGAVNNLGTKAQQFAWYHRLFHECGLIELPEVQVPSLPNSATKAAVRWRDGFVLKLRISDLYLARPSTTFAYSFAAHWCNMPKSTVQDAMKVNAKAQVFEQVGYDDTARCKIWGPGPGVRH